MFILHCEKFNFFAVYFYTRGWKPRISKETFFLSKNICMDTQNIFEAHISPLTLLIVVSSLNLLTHVTILQEAIYLIDSLVLL